MSVPVFRPTGRGRKGRKGGKRREKKKREEEEKR